jgi:S-adenosylmethionine decarboxylase proenzyme
MKGLHIIADLYHCSRGRAEGDLLTSAAKLRSLCVAACEAAGLTVLGEHFYQFDGADATQKGGTTGTVVLAESHLAIHTWPERDCATLDVYVCNYTADNSRRAETLYQMLIDALGPGAIQVERIWRGKDFRVITKKVA